MEQQGQIVRKTILVLLDGCRFDTGAEHAGYLEHLVEMGKGARSRGALKRRYPSWSWPPFFAGCWTCRPRRG